MNYPDLLWLKRNSHTRQTDVPTTTTTTSSSSSSHLAELQAWQLEHWQQILACCAFLAVQT
jgi:hypothetical protein